LKFAQTLAIILKVHHLGAAMKSKSHTGLETPELNRRAELALAALATAKRLSGLTNGDAAVMAAEGGYGALAASLARPATVRGSAYELN
jgi:hypothetical protein